MLNIIIITIIVVCMLEKSDVRVKENVWHYGRLKQGNPGKQFSLVVLWETR